jgi:hypothetical protein
MTQTGREMRPVRELRGSARPASNHLISRPHERSSGRGMPDIPRGLGDNPKMAVRPWPLLRGDEWPLTPTRPGGIPAWAAMATDSVAPPTWLARRAVERSMLTAAEMTARGILVLSFSGLVRLGHEFGFLAVSKVMEGRVPHAPIITNALWETMVAATAQGLERNGCDPSHQPSRNTASPDPSPLKPSEAVTFFPCAG